MSTSLTTRMTLSIMPIAIGVVLRHYYDRVLKDKNKSKNEEGAALPVPLRLEELMYDEAFTITRVSLLLYPFSLPHLKTPDRTSWTRQQSTLQALSPCDDRSD